jgi:hypothetical protein
MESKTKQKQKNNMKLVGGQKGIGISLTEIRKR